MCCCVGDSAMAGAELPVDGSVPEGSVPVDLEFAQSSEARRSSLRKPKKAVRKFYVSMSHSKGDVDDADDFVSPKKLKVSRESLKGKGLAKQNVYVKSKAGGKTKRPCSKDDDGDVVRVLHFIFLCFL